MTGSAVQPAARAGGPTCPMPCAEPFVPVLWLQILELLGRVPKGSTARFIQDGTLPGEARQNAEPYRLAS